MVTRLENRSKQTVVRRRCATNSKSDSLLAFLQRHRRQILRRWDSDVTHLVASPERESVLTDVWEGLIKLVEVRGCGPESGSTSLTPLSSEFSLNSRSILPAFLQILFTCSQSLQACLLHDAAFGRLPVPQQQAILQRIDIAFTILIHREINAVAEATNGLISQNGRHDLMPGSAPTVSRQARSA